MFDNQLEAENLESFVSDSRDGLSDDPTQEQWVNDPDRRRLIEATMRALEACHRVSKFYEAVQKNEATTAMGLLDAMRGLAVDGKPHVNPQQIWDGVSDLVLPVAMQATALPNLYEFASESQSASDLRRKPRQSRIEAALMAPALLLEDLDELCRSPGTTTPDAAAKSAERFNWERIRELFQQDGGAHSKALGDQVRFECGIASKHVRLLKRQLADSENRTTAVAVTPSVGPYDGAFYFRGQSFVMPHGSVANLIQFLWLRDDRFAPLERVETQLWPTDETGDIKSVRTRVNRFFADRHLPFAVQIDSRSLPPSVRIIDRPENQLANDA